MADDTAPTTPTLHLYVLLDRSGSMESMRSAVIEGFNGLLAEQQAAGGADARLTFVQFDGQDPQHVLADAIPMSEAVPITASMFRPRGSTPLLDATGRLIGRAADRVAQLGPDAESIVFATITDGFENASVEFQRSSIVSLVEQKTADGWTFVFLGADPSSYDEAGRMGYDARSTQRWAGDVQGARAAFDGLSKATASRRAKLAARESFDHRDYFEGEKSAEDDLRRRGGS